MTELFAAFGPHKEVVRSVGLCGDTRCQRRPRLLGASARDRNNEEKERSKQTSEVEGLEIMAVLSARAQPLQATGVVFSACPFWGWASVDQLAAACKLPANLRPSSRVSIVNCRPCLLASATQLQSNVMVSIRDRSIACSRSFRLLAAALESGNNEHRSLIDPTSLEDEYGRFRVWGGNLGAQQKGHSSLDYRLRESPLLQSNVLKLLQELENNINEGMAKCLLPRCHTYNLHSSCGCDGCKTAV